MESVNSRRNIQKGIAYFTLVESVVWFSLVVLVQFGIYMPKQEQKVKCRDRSEPVLNVMILPEIFFAFFWMYTVLYFFWFFWSFFVINAAEEDEGEQKKILKTWCSLTLLISFVDVASSVYLGMVYDNCMNNARSLRCGKFHPRHEGEKICYHEILPMFLITGKCFIFWFANITFATMILRMITKLNKQPPGPAQTSSPRTTIEIPRAIYRPDDDPPPPYEIAVTMARVVNQPTKNC